MSDDTETPSLREEQGRPPFDTPRERMADVPLAPHSGGVLGASSLAEGEERSADADRAAAEARAARPDDGGAEDRS